MAGATLTQSNMTKVLVNTNRVVDFINNQGEHLRCVMRDGIRGFCVDIHCTGEQTGRFPRDSVIFLGKDQGSADEAWDKKIRTDLMCNGSEEEFNRLMKRSRRSKIKPDVRVIVSRQTSWLGEQPAS